MYRPVPNQSLKGGESRQAQGSEYSFSTEPKKLRSIKMTKKKIGKKGNGGGKAVTAEERGAAIMAEIETT